MAIERAIQKSVQMAVQMAIAPVAPMAEVPNLAVRVAEIPMAIRDLSREIPGVS
jgi:hypothetical protein